MVAREVTFLHDFLKMLASEFLNNPDEIFLLYWLTNDNMAIVTIRFLKCWRRSDLFVIKIIRNECVQNTCLGSIRVKVTYIHRIHNLTFTNFSGSSEAGDRNFLYEWYFLSIKCTVWASGNIQIVLVVSKKLINMKKFIITWTKNNVNNTNLR